MPFSDFQGNAETVRQLREMLARDRFPHAVILAGPQGAGKYTLALMVARTMNCLDPRLTDGLPDFCGVCSNCTRIGQAEDLESRFAEAVEAREGLRETDKRETRILVQTHPDVLVVPPDRQDASAPGCGFHACRSRATLRGLPRPRQSGFPGLPPAQCGYSWSKRRRNPANRQSGADQGSSWFWPPSAPGCTSRRLAAQPG